MDGNLNAAKILPDLLDSEKAYKIAMRLAKPEPKEMTPEDTVGLCIDNGITREEYKRMRNKSRALGHDQYPSKQRVSFIYITSFIKISIIIIMKESLLTSKSCKVIHKMNIVHTLIIFYIFY